MINPLRCIYAGQHIGFMETAPGVETTVWKCTRRNRPTCTAECDERGCAVIATRPLDDSEPRAPMPYESAE